MNPKLPETIETATFRLGCFWSPDAQFGVIQGVLRTRVGYAGGNTENPTYHNIGNHINDFSLFSFSAPSAPSAVKKIFSTKPTTNEPQITRNNRNSHLWTWLFLVSRRAIWSDIKSGCTGIIKPQRAQRTQRERIER